MASVVRPWVGNLPFKMQAVLLSALRGCDGKERDDKAKKLTRTMRGVLLLPAVSNAEIGSFMNDPPTGEETDAFLKDLDHYPMHWLMHFTHAAEIIGYQHPDKEISFWWRGLYYAIATEGLHLLPETQEMLWNRLGPGDLG